LRDAGCIQSLGIYVVVAAAVIEPGDDGAARAVGHDERVRLVVVSGGNRYTVELPLGGGANGGEEQEQGGGEQSGHGDLLGSGPFIP
jgi:hypothetical protein